MKKILLAGGAGYIGTLLTSELANRGHSVTVIDNMWFGDHIESSNKIIKSKLDISNLQSSFLGNFDCVVFLAGLSNDPMADYSPKMNFVENTAVPINLAYLCKRAGVKRFVFASTCSVYGYTDDKLIDEDSKTLKPHFPYGISKLAAETAILNLEDSNFRPIALRKGTVGGWSPRMRFDLVVNAMTKSALTRGVITVNNPNIWRPLVDIKDVVKSYVRSVECDINITGIFNVSQDNYTIGRLANDIQSEIQSLTNRKIKLEVKNIQDFRNYKVTNDKAKTVLDFKAECTPKESVRDILKNTIEANKEFDFEQQRYYNIKTFKSLF